MNLQITDTDMIADGNLQLQQKLLYIYTHTLFFFYVIWRNDKMGHL